MAAVCFYQQPTCSPRLSREHVISAAVLRAVFGDPIRNLIRGDCLGEKALLDHEPVVRDVCERCNNEALSDYDGAGVRLIQQLIPCLDPTGLRLKLTSETMGWLLKTHLNYFRVVKDAETDLVYPVDQRIKTALVQRSDVPKDLYRLLVEGWVGEPYFWDGDDPRHIPWFQYRSVRFTEQRILLSDFRIKTLTTWLLLPTDANYEEFEARSSSALAEVYRDFGFAPLQAIDPAAVVRDGGITLANILELDAVKRFIVPSAGES